MERQGSRQETQKKHTHGINYGIQDIPTFALSFINAQIYDNNIVHDKLFFLSCLVGISCSLRFLEYTVNNDQ